MCSVSLSDPHKWAYQESLLAIASSSRAALFQLLKLSRARFLVQRFRRSLSCLRFGAAGSARHSIDPEPIDLAEDGKSVKTYRSVPAVAADFCCAAAAGSSRF